MDRTSHQWMELTGDGQVLAQRDEEYCHSPFIVGDEVYWLSEMYGGLVELRRRHRLSSGPNEAFGQTSGYSLQLFRDGHWFHWIAGNGLYRASTLIRFDLNTDTISMQPGGAEIFPIGVANDVLFGFTIPYMGAGANIIRIDYTTGQRTPVGDGFYGADDACALGDHLVWVSTAGDLRSMPIATVELPKPIAGLAPLTPRRMLCDGDVAYVGADVGGAAVIVKYDRTTGAIVRVADGLGTRVGAIAKFGNDLYWTLPDEGSIAHIRL